MVRVSMTGLAETVTVLVVEEVCVAVLTTEEPLPVQGSGYMEVQYASARK